MNRQQRQRVRRHSLPATSTMNSLSNCRVVPEGSEDFKKALEELLKHEPNHASNRSAPETAFNGLNKIEEDNESEYLDSDNIVPERENEMQTRIHKSHRRHSSPSCFADSADANTAAPNQEHLKEDKKKHTNFSKEYFKKHGRWPIPNEVKLQKN